MKLYRLTRKKYLEAALTGEGARLGGGRWNNKGVSLVYTSEHPALALLELRVHVPGTPPIDYQMLTIECPEDSIENLVVADLPANWDEYSSGPHTREIGDRFAEEGKFLALKVPSAITPIGYNLLLNPQHALMREVKVVESFHQRFDPRLWG